MFKTAHDILKNPNNLYAIGFNRALYGDKFPNVTEPIEVKQGYFHAKDMIEDGKVFYVHNFHDIECKEKAFLYGGFWCCNSCGKRGVDKDYWVVKVFKDGNEHCCIGEGFINLQESDNYGFGKTKLEAIKSYFDACQWILDNKDKQ